MSQRAPEPRYQLTRDNVAAAIANSDGEFNGSLQMLTDLLNERLAAAEPRAVLAEAAERAAGQTSGDALREADAQLLFIYEQVLKEMRTHAKGVPKGIIAEWVDRLDWHRDEHAKRKRAALGQTSTREEEK